QLLNAPGNHSYPIVAFTHLLVWQNNGCRHYSSDEAAAIKDFLEWVLTEGQKPENMAPGYVGLPSEVTQIGLNAVNSINDGC
ncbi:MAG: phosphate ABC transporter substrate-binding protein PstS, partial [Thermoplasmata archaeon]